jgi:hypothetical protein
MAEMSMDIASTPSEAKVLQSIDISAIVEDKNGRNVYGYRKYS